MKYTQTSPRDDDPAGVMKHANRFKGGTALIVLGGYSAADWETLYARLEPDVLLGANGVCLVVDRLDYWLCSENMNFSAGRAAQGQARYQEFMKMLSVNNAKTRLISHHSWNLIEDKSNAISIRRCEYDNMAEFSFREYGLGFLEGWVMKHTEAWEKGVNVNVGTVGIQLIHMAGILGCTKIHTIGFDLIFREAQKHHWYDYPVYQVDRFRNEKMFVDYKGIATQLYWLETAQYLKSIEPFIERDGIEWHDHSDGLLKLEGLKAAQ